MGHQNVWSITEIEARAELVPPPLLHNVPGGRCPAPRSFFPCLVPVTLKDFQAV